MVELARTATLIPHWPGHGSLRIEIRDDVVHLHAGHLEQLAGITPWSTEETLIEEQWAMFDGNPYYDLDVATARCEAAGTPQATEFLDWLHATLQELLTDDVLTDAHRAPSFLTAHTVQRAAEILDRDPAIRIGRTSLFAHMHTLGWIERPAGDWTPTPHARRTGWLTARTVKIPAPTKARARTYPQIYVTPSGLDELRRTLHALNSPPPEPATQPSLFD